jgi:hypothetical protein
MLREVVSVLFPSSGACIAQRVCGSSPSPRRMCARILDAALLQGLTPWLLSAAPPALKKAHARQFKRFSVGRRMRGLLVGTLWSSDGCDGLTRPWNISPKNWESPDKPSTNASHLPPSPSARPSCCKPCNHCSRHDRPTCRCPAGSADRLGLSVGDRGSSAGSAGSEKEGAARMKCHEAAARNSRGTQAM